MFATSASRTQVTPWVFNRQWPSIFSGKIWLSTDNPFTTLLMDEFHKTPLGGHMGVAKTLHHLQANFVWPQMRKAVHQYVAQCTICQQTKYEPKKPTSLLQPLPIPSSLWKDLTLDLSLAYPPLMGLRLFWWLLIDSRKVPTSMRYHLTTQPTESPSSSSTWCANYMDFPKVWFWIATPFSSMHFGVTCFDWVELSFEWVQPIIHNSTAKQRHSIAP